MMHLDSKQEQKIHRKYGKKLQDISIQIKEANALLQEIVVAIRREYR